MIQRKGKFMPLIILFLVILGFGGCTKNNPSDPEPEPPIPVDTTTNPVIVFMMDVKLYATDYLEFSKVVNRVKSQELPFADSSKYFQSTISQFKPLSITIRADTMVVTKPGDFKEKHIISIKGDKIFLLDTLSQKMSFFAYKVADKELKLPMAFYKKTLSATGKKLNSIGQDYGLEDYNAVIPGSLSKMEIVWLKLMAVYK